jgi:recombination protein U
MTAMRSYANRGKPLENLVIRSNELYRKRKVAVIEKQPTEWIPLRDRTGRIVGAKVEHKATVDFLGSFAGRPIAFDCKHVSRTKTKKGDRISLSEVQPHQRDFLDDWTRDGCPGFILVSFDLKRFFVVRWDWWKMRLALAEAHQGPPSLTLEELATQAVLPGHPVVVEVKTAHGYDIHYLPGVSRLFEGSDMKDGSKVWAVP